VDFKMKNQATVKTPRGENSRKKILETTSLLIGEFGSNNVTLDQVASQCKISKSSILWHFGSKDELFLEVVDSVYQKFEEAFIKKFSATLTPAKKIKHFLLDYGILLKSQPEIPHIFFSFVFNNKAQGKIKDKIQEIYKWNRKAFIQQLGISGNLAVILLGMLNGIVIQWIVEPEEIKINEILEEMIPIFTGLVDKQCS
jgi:AcrR family transcriptional regulator